MKRNFVKAFLSIVLLTSFILPSISGCASSANKNYYTVLQWLDKVENTFNLLYYTEIDPIVKSVDTTDAGFDIVQIAAEWGIINPDDNLNFKGKLTKEFAADTLVRAMNCVTPSAVDFSDSNKVNPLYLENVMSSVNEGIFDLEMGKFRPKKRLSLADADNAMQTAYDKWINFSYGESFDKSTIKENVINLGGVTSENSPVVEAKYSVKYTGSKTFFDEDGGYTDNTGKTITFRSNQVPSGLEVGSVLAMPADDVIPMNYAVVVTGLTTKSDGSVTVSTRNAELYEVYDEIDIQQSEELDFSEAVFYGPDGQRINFGGYETSASMSYSTGNAKAQTLSLSNNTSNWADANSMSLGLYRPEENETLKTGSKESFTVKLGDCLSVTISAPMKKNGGDLSFKIEGEVESDDGEKLSVEMELDGKTKVENRVKTHWDWFKLKVDELKLSKTDTITETFDFSCSAVKNFGKTTNKVNERKDGKWDIGDWATEGQRLRKIYGDSLTVGQSFKSLSSKANASSNKKLLDVIFPSTNLHFVIRAELTVEGSLKLTFTQSTMSGVELVKGKLRPIHEKSNSHQLDLSAKIELTVRLAFEFQLVGINVADLGCRAGVGAKVSSIIYSYDKSTDTLLEVCGIEGAAVLAGASIDASDEVQISETALQIQPDDNRTDRICHEVSVYPILSVFGCSSSSVAGKLFGSVEVKVLSEDTPFILVHYEINENGGGVVSECSISANENYGITTGDKLTLNMDSYAVAVRKDADTSLAIVTLPKKGSIKDVTISSDNTDVLEVENLLNKVTATALPHVSHELKVDFNGLNQFIPKEFDTKIKLSKTYKFGSSFYQEVSGNAKPQFALVGKKNGEANVTVSVNGESVTIPVKVGVGGDGIISTGALVAEKGTFTLTSGETVQTAFDYIPENKTIADITFKSSDTSVATVSKGGVIKAVGEGDTFITAILEGEEKSYSTTFTVHVVG